MKLDFATGFWVDEMELARIKRVRRWERRAAQLVLAWMLRGFA